MISQRALILGLLSFILAACGGGGGGGGAGNDPPSTTPPPGSGAPNNPPPEPPPPLDPVAEAENNARSARLRMTQVPGSAGTQLVIDWVDRFDDERGYQVQRRIGDGNWEIVEMLPPIDTGPGVWGRAVTVSAHYRVLAVLEDRSLPLHSSGDESEIYIDVDPATPLPTIQLDQTEPVRGPLQVSMQNAEGALSVTYLIENASLAQSTAGGTFPATIPAQHLVNGSRALRAFVQKSPGLQFLIQRPLLVDNPTPAVQLGFTVPADPQWPLVIRARASSPAGIIAVQFFVNGDSVHVAIAPESSGEYPGEYIYRMDQTTVASGPTAFRAVATDGNGATAVMDYTFTINRNPSLNITGLFDGMIATGSTVSISGEFGDDAAGATLTISAGTVRLLSTQISPFRATLLLANVPAGEHSVTVRVRDVSGRVQALNYNIIVPSTTLNYQVLDDDVRELLAADQNTLLYRKHSGAVLQRNSTGAPTQLPAASAGFASYALTVGRIVARGHDGHVYLLDASGQPIDLCGAGGSVGNAGASVRGPWVSWIPANDTSTIKLYNLQTETLRDVPIGSPLTAQLPQVVATPGHEQLLFYSTLAGTEGIYRYDLTTNAIQLMVSGRVGFPQSDGNRLVWFDFAEAPNKLLAAPLSNPTASIVLDSNYGVGGIDDGVVVWFDRDHRLSANDGTVTTPLAFPAAAYVLNDGQVIYSEDGRMQVWSPSRGERLWLDTTAPVRHANGVAYFLTAGGNTLYSVTLP